MTATPVRPRPYRRRISTFWWLRRRTYFAFVVRELTSVFVVWAVVFTLWGVRAVAQGDQAYHRFLDVAGTPALLALNVVALLSLVFHAVTWFNLAPRAMVVRVRGKRLPAVGVAAAHFLAWALVSAFVAWVVLS